MRAIPVAESADTKYSTVRVSRATSTKEDRPVANTASIGVGTESLLPPLRAIHRNVPSNEKTRTDASDVVAITTLLSNNTEVS
jgi:hypothetical protein